MREKEEKNPRKKKKKKKSGPDGVNILNETLRTPLRMQRTLGLFSIWFLCNSDFVSLLRLQLLTGIRSVREINDSLSATLILLQDRPTARDHFLRYSA